MQLQKKQKLLCIAVRAILPERFFQKTHHKLRIGVHFGHRETYDALCPRVNMVSLAGKPAPSPGGLNTAPRVRRKFHSGG